ncbi:hypothetical protein F8388_017245 [Cannabis sativa]|uniref:CCHC-type domain-containing protein n=1 Tax=Cannabis sativa TaxID=3483 RepID=A0A7J6I365_CANSA|nr:hypothetical protein F8388_017245 [Cannabis sativa]KAF4402002.1 hypothetical protein G4B88_017514 [Cannabis sativa]
MSHQGEEKLKFENALRTAPLPYCVKRRPLFWARLGRAKSDGGRTSKVSVDFCCGHLCLFKEKFIVPSLSGFVCVSGFVVGSFSGKLIMAAMNILPLVDEIIHETENFCLDDFSIDVTPDTELAKETIAHSLVGRFFSKKTVSNGTLRKALSGLWKLHPGWRFQTVKPRTFIFRLGSSKEVKYVLDNGPWNLCSGFLLVAALPEDGKWESADLSSMDIWVKARGVPLPFLTESCIQQMASRMGKLLQANKVRKNGVILNDYLRFQVWLNLAVPLLAGVSLPEYGQKKVWSFFKYEKLPIFCFKCGVIGHVETDCSGKKRMVTVQDGRNIPLFGSWLRDGSRLENGFALLEVESLNDRNRLENFDPVLEEMPLKDGQDHVIPVTAAVSSGGHTRVERDGMEGVVSQRADNSFNVAYNDYVDTSKFPSQHVVHVAKLFQEKLGPIKFGANREDGEKGKEHSGKIKKLKKPRVVGPRGIPKNPIFGKNTQEPGNMAGSKRKKVESDQDFGSKFTDESRGNSCLIFVEKTRVKDVFAETSGVNVLGESNNLEDSEEQAKKARMFLNSLRSVEGSFEGIKDGDDVMADSVDVTKVVFSNVLNGPAWHCLFVYGPPTKAARKEFWEERTLEVLALNHPWLLLGDLNTISGQQDKVGGREVEASDGSDLNELLDSTGGVDLGCVGNHFTWTNGRRFQDLIKERLDRALCDPEWMMTYPKAGVRALAIKDSDHAPLVVDLLLDRERFHTPFRYLDAWNESCWLIADGSKVDLWNSPWIPWLNWDMFRAAFNPLCVQNSIKVSTLLNENGEWLDRLTHRWFVPSVASSLSLIGRLHTSQEDHLVWKDATNGLFSPKAAYKSIIKCRWGETDQLWHRIWKLKITERLRMFLWKLCRDIIPFGSRLQRIFGNEVRCILCGKDEDSAHHLFFKCPLAKAVWFASRWALRSEILWFDSPRNMVEWLLSPGFLQGADDNVSGEFTRFGICLFDVLWSARNCAFHENVNPSWQGVLAKVNHTSANLRIVWDIPSGTGSLQQSLTEIYSGKLVLLVDAAFKDLRAAAGIVVTISEGSLLEAMAANYASDHALEAEMRAVIYAVNWCKGRDWKQTVLVSDCQLLVHGIHARRTPDWRLAGLFWELVQMLDDLPEVELVWHPRATVQVAHNLARWSLSNAFSGFFSAEDLAPLVAM